MSSDLLIAYTDGASRGNPGPASTGVYVENESGELVSEHCEFIGTATNNVAEYKALILALEELKNLNAQKIVIRSDSELMVKQIKGQYRVKNPGIKPLYNEAMNLFRSFPEYKIEHVRREFNKEADRLANQALDERQ